MDAIRAKLVEETSAFGPGDDVKWRNLYEPLLTPFPPDVRVVRDQRYGPADRNLLDVYVPPQEPTDKPVLLFVHGGGFHAGDKCWSDKCYANVGYYFAQQGIVTVVATYRLVPHVQYPGGADDIQMMRQWIHDNISAAQFGHGSADRVILCGHSAGGGHIAMNLFAAGDSQRPLTDPLTPPVAGVMFLGVPFWYDMSIPVRQKTMRSYYGSDQEDVWGPRSALGLLRHLPEDSPILDSRRLPIYIGLTEWDIVGTVDSTMMFFDGYRARSKPADTLPMFHVLKGHNHLSGVLSIGTEDTALADEILHFVRSCVG